MLIQSETVLIQGGDCSIMRITRRRQRQVNSFVSPDWMRAIFDQLKAAFPLLSPLDEKDMVRLARAVGHVERYSATDTRRGGPAHWPREDLARVGLALANILRRETSGRMPLTSFVDHYLRILDFPKALSGGSFNLFEAELRNSYLRRSRCGGLTKVQRRRQVETVKFSF